MAEQSERVLLGRIVGVSGLKGWVKIHSDTDPREDIGKYGSWQLGNRDTWTAHQVQAVKRQGKRLIGKLAGCDSREAAESLVGLTIAIDAEQLAALESGQYYWRDLQGLRVSNLDGIEFGIIKRIFDTGANDVIVVKGESERMIPWIPGDVITDVDLDRGTLTVDWDPEF